MEHPNIKEIWQSDAVDDLILRKLNQK